MKVWIALVILLGFTGLAGASAILDSHNLGGSCIANTVQRADCPPGANPLAGVDFHANALKVFSTAAFQPLLVTLLLTIFAWLSISLLPSLLMAPAISSGRSHDRNDPLNLVREQRSWLALLERRDPAAI